MGKFLKTESPTKYHIECSKMKPGDSEECPDESTCVEKTPDNKIKLVFKKPQQVIEQ